MRTSLRNTPVSAYSLVAVYLAAFSLSAASFLLSLTVIQQSEQKACTFAVAAAADARGRVQEYQNNPPQTEAGQGQKRQAERALAQAQELVRSFECAT